jgi:hypothetical protein
MLTATATIKWHDDIVIARHLENHGHRGHRRARTTTDHRSHADDRKRSNADVSGGVRHVGKGAQGAAKRCTHEQRW